MNDQPKNNPVAKSDREPQWERRARRALEQRMIDNRFGGETAVERRLARIAVKRMLEGRRQQLKAQREGRAQEKAAQADKVKERKRQRELLKSQRVEILAAKPPECLTKKQQKRVMEARLTAAAEGKQFHAASLERRKTLVPDTAEERDDWADARELVKRMVAARRSRMLPPR